MFVLGMQTSMMILIAGPYASGTGGDPDLMQQNLERLEKAAWPLFEAGHIPMIGEWVALPVLSSAGASGAGDPLAERVMYPTAQRLLQRCAEVLRLPGDSRGADQDVAIARARNLPIYYHLADVPAVDLEKPSALSRRMLVSAGSRAELPTGRPFELHLGVLFA